MSHLDLIALAICICTSRLDKLPELCQLLLVAFYKCQNKLLYAVGLIPGKESLAAQFQGFGEEEKPVAYFVDFIASNNGFEFHRRKYCANWFISHLRLAATLLQWHIFELWTSNQIESSLLDDLLGFDRLEAFAILDGLGHVVQTIGNRN